MALYAIVLDGEAIPKLDLAYWVTRVGTTDNYSFDLTDATLFASKSAALALMRTLGLDEKEHRITDA